MQNAEIGILYLVATPIGNLSDISERAISTLRSVDFIAAEDTRVSRKLTAHLNIKKPLVSYHAHNQENTGKKILARILSGENCALITDAGTPGISDPGEDLVRLCIDAGIRTVVIPGPCAAIAGLALSGLATGRFAFEGFLSANKGRRLAQLEQLEHEKRTMVFFEAPHKLVRTLTDMKEAFGNRRISISREITKIYEETLHLTLTEAAAHFSENPPRGEFVLVVEGAHDLPSRDDELGKAIDSANALIDSGFTARDAVKKAASDAGCSRNELYKAVIIEREKPSEVM